MKPPRRHPSSHSEQRWNASLPPVSLKATNYSFGTKTMMLFSFENKINITTLNCTKLFEKHYFLVTSMYLLLCDLLLNKHFSYSACDWIHKDSFMVRMLGFLTSDLEKAFLEYRSQRPGLVQQ